MKSVKKQLREVAKIQIATELLDEIIWFEYELWVSVDSNIKKLISDKFYEECCGSDVIFYYDNNPFHYGSST